jgi:cytosine/adenosine deaminase-related metal-dependent hydrolase
VLAEPDILLKNAAVHVSDPGRISRIEPWNNPPPHLPVQVVDWGSAVIMPGMVNAHTHLELTNPGDHRLPHHCFADRIQQFLSMRGLRTQETRRASAREGVRLALSSGTTMVGDFGSGAVSRAAAEEGGLKGVLFEEMMGFSKDQAEEALSKLSRLPELPDTGFLLEQGISPHAPYSASPDLYRHAAEIARRSGKLLATHAAGTMEEIEFLEKGSGRFREFLSASGILPASWVPPGLPPVPYLDSLGILGSNCLLIHCNCLDRESIQRILKTRSSVVYCPRLHEDSGCGDHPVRQLLDSGINVALGTGSLACNTSLSIIDEMRFLYKKRKDIKAEEIFRAATLNGAAALNRGASLGRLRRGYWADMTVLALPENVGARQLLNQILEGAGECLATIIQGRIVWEKETPKEVGPDRDAPGSDFRPPNAR